MKRFLLVIGILFLWVGCAGADCGADFIRANSLYKEGQFAQALSAYEKLIEEGHGNSALYYNTANSYYKTGKPALALLNYERAARWIPRDPDLRINREVVRSKLEAEEFHPGRAPIAVAAFFLFGSWTVSESVWCLSGLYFLIFGSFLGMIFHPPWRRGFSAFAGLCLCIFILGSVSLTEKIVLKNHVAVVLAEKAPVRFEPLEGSDINFHVPEGTEIFVMETREGWDKIMRSDGKTGWMKADSCEII